MKRNTPAKKLLHSALHDIATIERLENHNAELRRLIKDVAIPALKSLSHNSDAVKALATLQEAVK